MKSSLVCRMFEELATCDDLAFLIMVVEQFFRKWQRKVLVQLLRQKKDEDPFSTNKRQKTKRNKWKEFLVYKDGNGLSGKSARRRCKELRTYIGSKIKSSEERRNRAEGHFLVAWNEWKDNLGIKKNGTQQEEVMALPPPLPAPEEEMDELDLEELACIFAI